MVERRVNQRFENHLCSCHQGNLMRMPDDEKRGGSLKLGLLAVLPFDAAACTSK
jgi:hypothetical protein